MPFFCKSQRGENDVNSLTLSLIALSIASSLVRLGTAVSSHTTEFFVAFRGSEINV